MDNFEVKTALLVDFTAAYKMKKLRASGKNSRNIEFDIILDDHLLQFVTFYLSFLVCDVLIRY